MAFGEPRDRAPSAGETAAGAEGPAYARATSLEQALAALDPAEARDPVVTLAGGTDLMTLIHQGLARPRRLLDIGRLGDLRGMERGAEGQWRIGALVTLAELARPGALPGPYRALAEAAAASATPALRNRATLGGNLEQQVRCWYFRSGLPCRFAGDAHCSCAAPEAAGPFQALFGHGPGEPGEGCGAVHPSDPAVALVALDAWVELARWEAGGIARRRVPAGAYFTGRAEPGRPGLTAREPGELVVAVYLPPLDGPCASTYRKVTDRRAWQFALVSLAAWIRWDREEVAAPGPSAAPGRTGAPAAGHRGAAGGGTAPVVREARLVLGGVALKPWRLERVEAWLAGRQLDAATAWEAGTLAVEGARPLPGSGFKVELVRSLVADTLVDLATVASAATGA
ncbi:FAD binding domain-containing protein [Thermaerobacter marianensis]|uniref:FAD binding domain-containing protein n=1 Tax=Thermaerobacter marianensis TaxID=73919 RepID=UPI001FA7BDB0|nr:FAD binding domain-containing protein [Thermaerobacter marianensis]